MFNPVWQHKRQALIVLLALAVAATPLSFAGEEMKWGTSIEKGLAEAKKSGKPILMDFYTEW